MKLKPEVEDIHFQTKIEVIFLEGRDWGRGQRVKKSAKLLECLEPQPINRITNRFSNFKKPVFASECILDFPYKSHL